MRFAFLVMFIFSFLSSSFPQQFSLATSLSNTVNETSGLIYLNGKLITHNDSGGDAALYEIDSLTGNVTRKVTITNATNVDWEDICNDSTYIYIADMGNNNGNRTNLKIYRVLISDYFTGNTATADVINFTYSDQTDFSSNPYAHNFDAEALIAYHDSLYIFTKNWVNQRTNIYPLSKLPGSYQITKTDSFNAQCLITGGTYNTLSGRIVLSGYTLSYPFVIELSDFTFPKFSDGTITKYAVTPPSGYSIQMEAVIYTGFNSYFLSTEKRNGDPALYKLVATNPLGVEFIDSIYDSIFPNPASSTVNIDMPNVKRVEIYALNGTLISSHSSTKIDVSNLPSGTYILVVTDQTNTKFSKRKLIIL